MSTNVTAAGTDASSAAALTDTYNIVTGGTGGVKLPSLATSPVVVENNGPDPVNVYSATGEPIYEQIVLPMGAGTLTFQAPYGSKTVFFQYNYNNGAYILALAV